MDGTKRDRILEIFFRAIRGENLSVHALANEYEVSTKSITRDINDLKAFLADHRELVGNTELAYSTQSKCYHLYMDEFLTNKELFSLLEVLIGARALGEQGVGMISSALFSTLGGLAIPVVGNIVGSMVGYAIASASYGTLLNSIKEAKASYEERVRVEGECEE